MLCTPSDTFWILAYSALCFFRYMRNLLRHIHSYDIFRLIQAYSGPCVTFAYSQPCHILRPSIFRTVSLFKTLWNVDHAYLEPCYRALFSHIHVYSEPFATLVYTETWHTRNRGILRTLPKLHPLAYSEPVISTKIFEYSEL